MIRLERPPQEYFHAFHEVWQNSLDFSLGYWTFLWTVPNPRSRYPEQTIALLITGEIELRNSCQNRSLENVEAAETVKQQKEEVGITLPNY